MIFIPLVPIASQHYQELMDDDIDLANQLAPEEGENVRTQLCKYLFARPSF